MSTDSVPTSMSSEQQFNLQLDQLNVLREEGGQVDAVHVMEATIVRQFLGDGIVSTDARFVGLAVSQALLSNDRLDAFRRLFARRIGINCALLYIQAAECFEAVGLENAGVQWLIDGRKLCKGKERQAIERVLKETLDAMLGSGSSSDGSCTTDTEISNSNNDNEFEDKAECLLLEGVSNEKQGTNDVPMAVVFTLPSSVCLVGREGCDVKLHDPSASNFQCSIRKVGSAFVITAPITTNPTVVNGNLLNPGDQLPISDWDWVGVSISDATDEEAYIYLFTIRILHNTEDYAATFETVYVPSARNSSELSLKTEIAYVHKDLDSDWGGSNSDRDGCNECDIDKNREFEDSSGEMSTEFVMDDVVVGVVGEVFDGGGKNKSTWSAADHSDGFSEFSDEGVSKSGDKIVVDGMHNAGEGTKRLLQDEGGAKKRHKF